MMVCWDVKDKTNNYNYIAKIQIKDAQSALDKFSKEEWDKYDYRQKTWDVHKETKTIPLIYSEDFSENSPKREHCDKFESTLKAVEEKLINKHSKGSIVRAILKLIKTTEFL